MRTAPAKREYIEHRLRFHSSHRASLLTVWSVAGGRDALAAGRSAEALVRVDVLIVALEQVAIDSGSLLMGGEMLWDVEPPPIAFAAVDQWRRPSSALCDPAWRDAAYHRIRDLDDWDQRKKRLTKGGGKGKNGKAAPGDPLRRQDALDAEAHGGQNDQAALDADGAPAQKGGRNPRGRGRGRG